jgi:predicted nucleic acid-binding protein
LRDVQIFRHPPRRHVLQRDEEDGAVQADVVVVAGLYLEGFVVEPYNRRLCTMWAEVTVAAQLCRPRIECADAWIAAAALRHYGQ